MSRRMGQRVCRTGWAAVAVALVFSATACGVFRTPHVVTIKDPLSPDEHMALGIAYEREGKRALARAEYQAVLRTRPESVRALVNLGNLAVADGRQGDAESWYRRAVRAGGKAAAPAANNLAWLYLTQNRRLAPAATLAKKAIAWDAKPAYYDTWVAILLASAKPLDAASAIDEAEARWADDVKLGETTKELMAQRTREFAQLAHAMAKSLLAEGKLDEASSLLREAARRDQERSIDYLGTLAEGFIAAERLDEASHVIDEVAAKPPSVSRFAEKKRELADLAHAQGKTMLRDGRLDSAEALVRGAARWDPGRAAYYFDTLAQVLIAQEKPYEAGAIIDEADALAPSGDTALRARLYDRKAELFTSQGLTAEAQAAAQQAEALRKAANP